MGGGGPSIYTMFGRWGLFSWETWCEYAKGVLGELSKRDVGDGWWNSLIFWMDVGLWS